MDGYYKIDFLLPTNQDWSDSYTMGNGDPFVAMDLTGCTFEMHIRKQVNDLGAVMILNAANTRLGISGDPVNGTVAIYVPDEQVQRIADGAYVHDIVMFNASGNPKRIAVGSVVVERGVTRV